jgi:hypothetical protein
MNGGTSEIDGLKQQLQEILDMLDACLKDQRAKADQMGIRPEQMQTVNGGWVLPDILVAKVKVLLALQDLKNRG